MPELSKSEKRNYVIKVCDSIRNTTVEMINHDKLKPGMNKFALLSFLIVLISKMYENE